MNFELGTSCDSLDLFFFISVFNQFDAQNLFCSKFYFMLADSEYNQHDIYLLRVYNVEILLMMDSGPVRNM